VKPISKKGNIARCNFDIGLKGEVKEIKVKITIKQGGVVRGARFTRWRWFTRFTWGETVHTAGGLVCDDKPLRRDRMVRVLDQQNIDAVNQRCNVIAHLVLSGLHKDRFAGDPQTILPGFLWKYLYTLRIFLHYPIMLPVRRANIFKTEKKKLIKGIT
jgi:hypothetical protein